MKLKILFLSIILTMSLNAQDANDMQLSTFAALNKISVTIGGNFITNGTFPAVTTERVDEFVTRIFNEHKLALLANKGSVTSLDEETIESDKYADRDIVLKHFDGSEQIIDLKKFRLTADYLENPYLLNGDVLIFPQFDESRSFIEIQGAVNNPTKFQYVDGDRLSEAILFSRGIDHAFENRIDKIEIVRLSYDGMNEEIITTTINENIELERGDRIRVVANENLKKDFKVLVIGEVNIPGFIYITKDNSTIKQVIEKSGGFKKSANLKNAELIRSQKRGQGINYDRKLDFLLMNRMADIEAEDSLSLIYDNQLRNAKSIVTVDFNKVLDDSSENSKFIVKDGDIIYIPENTGLINVFGQVMNPGFVDFVEGKDYSYYIAKSGGFGGRAKDAVFLVKNKTRAWVDMTDEDKKYEIESGDYIWVPKDIPRDFDHYLTRVSKIAAVVSSVATLYLIFRR